MSRVPIVASGRLQRALVTGSFTLSECNVSGTRPSLTLMSQSTKLRPVKVGTATSPAMRVIAAVVLVGWSLALAICWHHCATGACSSTSKAFQQAQPGCHAPAEDSEPENSKPNGMGGACFAKKPFVGEKEIVCVAAAPLQLAYLSTAFQAIALDLANSSEDIQFRNGRSRDWVFTPEVCLGPAFRSHAPPVVS
jgi:hypothetical protein